MWRANHVCISPPTAAMSIDIISAHTPGVPAGKTTPAASYSYSLFEVAFASNASVSIVLSTKILPGISCPIAEIYGTPSTLVHTNQ